MKIMLLACLPAFLRACVKFVSLCACRKVKKKDPEDPEKGPRNRSWLAARGLRGKSQGGWVEKEG